ncbi:MAG: phosphoribosylglycinamide synthetase C domain-containing protein, partial [Cyanobacteria bacterium J06636_28]
MANVLTVVGVLKLQVADGAVGICGRILGVTALGGGFGDAIANAYRAVSNLQFEHAYYRQDIGHRV